MEPTIARRKSSLERLLGVFTEVRAGEGVTALLLMLNVLLLLLTYYIVKPVRDALILTGSGAEVKSYTSAGQAMLLLAVVPAYAALASRLPRRKLINTVTLIFAACLVGFYALVQANTPYIDIAFFLWAGIFNLMIVAQFWSLANDIYTPAEGKRLFPLIGFGASLGAATGAFVASRLIPLFGVNQMLILAAALLASTLLLTNWADARARRHRAALPVETGAGPSEPPQSSGEEEALSGKTGAFRLVMRNPYLLLIGLLLLLLNWVNTTGGYILDRIVLAEATQRVAAGLTGGLTEAQFTGQFFSEFYFIVNIVGVVLQLFVVSRVLKYLGVRIAVLVLPLIALSGYLVIAFFPVLAIIRWVKTAENATDYSLFNTVRAVLFLPTTREEKYKAKQAIDTFFVRIGDMLSAAIVLIGTQLFAFSTRTFAILNLVLVGIWIVVAVRLGVMNRRLVREQEASAA